MAAISSTPRPAYIYDSTLAAWVPIGGPQGVEGGTTTLTTKGDILTRTSSAIARQAVGTDNFILISDSSAANGISWTGTPKITTINNITGAAGTPTLWSDVTTGSIAIGAGLTTGALNIATVGTGATPISIGHTNATIGLTGNTTITGTLTAGSSSNKTTAYPVAPTGTTSGTVTQAAQLSGYIGMPQNAQATSGTFAYTFAASDAGKHIYATGTPTSATFTIPANSAVAFEIGTTFVVMNDLGAATNISIAITTDTLQLAGTGTTGTRTLARYGVASITKVTSTKWIISGNGLT